LNISIIQVMISILKVRFGFRWHILQSNRDPTRLASSILSWYRSQLLVFQSLILISSFVKSVRKLGRCIDGDRKCSLYDQGSGSSAASVTESVMIQLRFVDGILEVIGTNARSRRPGKISYTVAPSIIDCYIPWHGDSLFIIH
jgi:hypothetical protein